MSALATIVYLLCLAASAACGWLLVRSYNRHRSKLLLWSAICFVLLAINNLLVVIDLIVLPQAIDLGGLRLASSLAAIAVLLYGFIWELD